jgi:hypothetical protein
VQEMEIYIEVVRFKIKVTAYKMSTRIHILTN